jgi:hypothetical protein
MVNFLLVFFMPVHLSCVKIIAKYFLQVNFKFSRQQPQAEK